MAGSPRGFWETGTGLLTAIAGIITAVTGLLVALDQLGVLRDAPPPAVEEERPADPVRAAAADPLRGAAEALLPESGAPAPSPSPPAPSLPDLSGHWRDATGTVYEIVPAGEGRFRFTALNPLSGYASQGESTLQGSRFSSDFVTNLPSIGSGSGTVSADGRRIEGTFFDSVLGGYSLVIYR